MLLKAPRPLCVGTKHQRRRPSWIMSLHVLLNDATPDDPPFSKPKQNKTLLCTMDRHQPAHADPSVQRCGGDGFHVRLDGTVKLITADGLVRLVEGVLEGTAEEPAHNGDPDQRAGHPPPPPISESINQAPQLAVRRSGGCTATSSSGKHEGQEPPTPHRPTFRPNPAPTRRTFSFSPPPVPHLARVH